MGGGGYLLLVLNPPWTPEHKEAILQRVAKGLLSWDVKATGTDLASAEKACLSVKVAAGPHNELLIQHSTESLALEVLLNPEVSTLRQCFKNMMVSGTTHKHVIHAGYAFSGTGDWILQDGVFSARDVEALLHDAEVEEVLRRQKFHTLHVHCSPEGGWSSQPPTGVSLNPPDIADSLAGSAHLLGCLDAVLTSPPLTSLLPSSSVVGNIRFRRPTMYVFPGGQGDCALFGVTGFTLLVDGGFARKPCFWEFVRHLDRLDSLLVTRFNQFNSCGLTALAQRKALERVYPQVGHVFCNAVRSPSDEELQKDRDQLLVSVVAQGLEFLQGVREMGLSPQACQRDARPLTLFHKVGQGTLEMFVLSPGRVTEEDTSVCVLLVWRPSKASEPVTRILLPGSAPQSVIFDGLSKLSHLAVLRSRTVTAEERLGLKRSKVQDKPLRATSVPPRPSVAKRAAAKGESPSPSPTPPLPEKTKPKVHTNRSVESLPKKHDEVKRPPAKPTKREAKKPAADKTDAKEDKVAKITAKVAAKVADTTPDKEKIVEKLGENEVDNVEEKDISKLIDDKPLKKLPVEIGKIDQKAQEIVAKVEEKVTAKRELKKATPTRPPAKSKGAKDVTNKMAVEGKTVARKTAEPTKAKPRPVVAPPTRPMVRDSRSKSPSSSASSSPKRAPPKPASERPVRSVRGGVRTAKPTPTEPAKVTEGEKPVVTEKPTAQVKPDKRIEIVTQSGDESSGSKEAIEEKAATEATKEDKPFIEPSSSDESKKDVEKPKPSAIVDELPIKAVLLGTTHAAPPDEDVQKAPTRPFEKEIADAEMWPTAGDAKEMPEPPGLALSPEPTISASSEGVPSLVDEVIDVSLQADSSVARPITEPDLSQVRALSSGQRTPDSLDTPREVGDGTAPSSRDEILDAMEKHRLVSREQVLEIKRRDSVDSIEGEIAAEEEEIPHQAEETEQKETEKLPQPSLADKPISDVMPEAQEPPSDAVPSETVPKPAETKETDLQEEPKPDVPVSVDSVKQGIELPSPVVESGLDETKPVQLGELIPEPPARLDDEKEKADAQSVPERGEEIVAKHVAEKEETLPVGEAPAVGEIKADDIQEKPLTEHAVLPQREEPEQDVAAAPERIEKILPKDFEEPSREGLKLPADDTHIRDEMELEDEIKPVAQPDVVSPKREEPDMLESIAPEAAGITAAEAEPLKVEPQLPKLEEQTSEHAPAVAELKPDEEEPTELKETTAEPLAPLEPELAAPFKPEVSTAKPAESEDALKETPQLEETPTAGEREPSRIAPAELEEIKSQPPSLQPHKETEVPVSAETEMEQTAPLIDDLSQKEPQLEKAEDVARERILPLGDEHILDELKPDMPAEPVAEVIVSAEHREPDATVSALPESADKVAAEPEDVQEKEQLAEKPEEHIRDFPSPPVKDHELDSGEERQAPAAVPERTEPGTPVSSVPGDEKPKPDDAQAPEPLSYQIDDHGRAISSPTADKPEPVETKPSEIPEAKVEPALVPEHEAPEAAEKVDTEPEELKKIEPDLKKLEDQGTDRVSPAVAEYTPSETEQKEPEKLRAEPAAYPEHEEPKPTISAMPEVVEKTPPEQDYLKKQELQPEMKEGLSSVLPPLPADEHEAGKLEPLERAEIKAEPAAVTDRVELEPAISPVIGLAAETAAEPSDLQKQERDFERPDDGHRDFPSSDIDEKEPRVLSPSQAEPILPHHEQLEAPVSPAREGVEKGTAEPEDAKDSEELLKKPEDRGGDLPSPAVHEHKLDELMPAEHEVTMEPAPLAEHVEPEAQVSHVPEADKEAADELQHAKEEEPHLEKPEDLGPDVPSASVSEDKLEKSEHAEKEPEAVLAVESELRKPDAATTAITEPADEAAVESPDLKQGEKDREKPDDRGIDLASPPVAEDKLSEVETKPEETKAVQELSPELKASPAISPVVELAEERAPEKVPREQEPQLEKEDHTHDLAEPSLDEHKPEKLLSTEAEPEVKPVAAPELKEAKLAPSPVIDAARKITDEREDLKDKEPQREKPEDYGVDLGSGAVIEHKPSELKATEPEDLGSKPAAFPDREDLEPTISLISEISDKVASEREDVTKESLLEKKEEHDRDLTEPSFDEHKPEKLLPTEAEPEVEPAAAPEFKEAKLAPSPVIDAARKTSDEREDVKDKEPERDKPEDYGVDLGSAAVIEQKPSELKATEPEDLGRAPATFPAHEDLKPAISPISEISDKVAPEREEVTKESLLEKKEEHDRDLAEPSVDEDKSEKLLPSERKPEIEPAAAPELKESKVPLSPVIAAAGKTADEPEDLEEKEPQWEKPDDSGIDLISAALIEHKPSELKAAEPEDLGRAPAAFPDHEEMKPAASPIAEISDQVAPEKDVTKGEPLLEKEDHDGDLSEPSADRHKPEKLLPTEAEPEVEPAAAPELKEAKVVSSPIAEISDQIPREKDVTKEERLLGKEDHDGDLSEPSADRHKPEKLLSTEAVPEVESAAAPELKEAKVVPSPIAEISDQIPPEKDVTKEEALLGKEDHDGDLSVPSADRHKPEKLLPTEAEAEVKPAAAPELKEAKAIPSPIAEISDQIAPEKDVTKGEPLLGKKDHDGDLSEPSADRHKPEKLLPTEAEPEVEPAAAPELKEAKIVSSPVIDAAKKTTDKPEDLKDKEPQREKPEDYGVDLGSAAVIEHKPSELKATEPEDLGKEPAAFPDHEELKPALSPISETSDKMAPPEREDAMKEEPLLEKKEDHDGNLPEPSVDEHKPEKLLPTETEPKAELAAEPKIKEPETTRSPATETADETPGEPDYIKEKVPPTAEREDRGAAVELPAVAEHKPSEMEKPKKMKAEPAALPDFEEPKSALSPEEKVADKMAAQEEGITEKEPHLEEDDLGHDLHAPSVDKHEPETIKPADTEPTTEPSLFLGHGELKAPVSPLAEAADKTAAETEDLKGKEPQQEKRGDYGTDVESPAFGAPKPSEIKGAEPEELRVKPASSPGHEESRPVESQTADVSDKAVPEKKDFTEKEPHLEEREERSLDLAEPSIDELKPDKVLPTETAPKAGATGVSEPEESTVAVSAVTEAPGKKSAEAEGLKEEEPHLEKPEERGVALESPAIAAHKPSEIVTEPEKPSERTAVPAYEAPKPVTSPTGEVPGKMAPEKEDITKEEPRLEKKEDDRRDLPSSAVEEHEPEKVKPTDTEPKAEPSLVAEHDELDAALSPVIEAGVRTAAEPKDLKEEPQQEKPEDHGADLASPSVDVHQLSEMKATEPEEVRAEVAPLPDYKEPKLVASPMAEVSDKTAAEKEDLTEEKPHLEEKEDRGLDLVAPSIDKLKPEKLLPPETEPEEEPAGVRELEKPEAAVSTAVEPSEKKTPESESLREEEPHLEKPEEPAALPKHEIPKSAVSPVPDVAEKTFSGKEDVTKEGELDAARKIDSEIPSPSVDELEATELKPSESEPKAEPAAVPVVEETKTAFTPMPESLENKGVEREDLKDKEPHLEKTEDRGIDLESPAVPEHKLTEFKVAEAKGPRLETAALPEHEEPKLVVSPTEKIADKAAPKTELKEQTPEYEKKEADGHVIPPPSLDDRKPGELKSTEVEKGKESAIFPEHEKPQDAVSPLLEPREMVGAHPEEIKEQGLSTEKPEDKTASEPAVLKEEPCFEKPDDHDHDTRSATADEREVEKIKPAEPKDLEASSAVSPQRDKPDGAVSPLIEVSAKSSPISQHPESLEPHLEETEHHDLGLASPAIDSQKPDELKLAKIEEPKPETAVLPEYEKPQTAALPQTEMAPKTDTVPEDLKKQKADVEKMVSPPLDGHKYDDLMPADTEQTIEKATASPEPKEPRDTASPIREAAEKSDAEPEDLKRLDSHFETPEHGRDLPSRAADEKKVSEVKSTEPEAQPPDLADHKEPGAALSLLPEVSDKAPQPSDLPDQEPKMADTDDRVADFPSPAVDDRKPGELKPTDIDESKADSALLPEHQKLEVVPSPSPEVVEKAPAPTEDLKKQEAYPEKAHDRLSDLPLASLELEAGEEPLVLTDQAQPEAPPSPEPKVDEKLAAKTKDTEEQKQHLKELEGDGRDLPSPVADVHKPGELKSTASEPEAKAAVIPEEEAHEVPLSLVAKGADTTVSEPEDLQKKVVHVEEPEKGGIEPPVSSLSEAAETQKREHSKEEPPFEKDDRDHELLSLVSDKREVDAFKPADTAGFKAEPSVVPEHKEPETAVRSVPAVVEKVAAQPEDLQKQEPQLERPEDHDRDLPITGVDEHKVDEFKPDELEHTTAQQAVLTEKVKREAPVSLPPEDAKGTSAKHEHDKQEKPLLEQPDHVPSVPSSTLDEHVPVDLKPAGREEPRAEPGILFESEQPEVPVIPAPKDADKAASEHEEDIAREPHLRKPDDRCHDVAPPSVDKHKTDELKPDVTEDAGAETAASQDHELSNGGVSAVPEAKQKQLAAAEVVKKDESLLEKPDHLARELPSPAAGELKPSEVKSTELDEPRAQPTELPKHEQPDVASSPVPEAFEKSSLEPADSEQEKLRSEKPELSQSVVDEHKQDRVKPEAAEKETAKSEDLKKLEPHLERPVDQARKSPLSTVGDREPKEERPEEPTELHAEPAAFPQKEMTEATSSPPSDAPDKKAVPADLDKRQEPEFKEPGDDVSDLALNVVHEPKLKDLKSLESKELGSSPSMSSALNEPEATEPAARKVVHEEAAAPDHLKTQEPDLKMPGDHSRGEHKLDELRTPEIQDLEAGTDILHELKEPDVSDSATAFADETPAVLEDLKAKESQLEKPEGHGSDIPLPELKDQVTSEVKPVDFKETKKEPVFADHEESEAALHSVAKATDKPTDVPEDLKVQERYPEKSEEPIRDITSTADQLIPDELTHAKPEDQKPEAAIFPEPKEPESVLHPVPEDMDKKEAMTEDGHKPEPHLEQQKDHAHEIQSTIDVDKASDLKPSQLEEQEAEHRTPGVTVGTTPEIADKSTAAPGDHKKQEPQWEQPKDESHDHVSAVDRPGTREFLPADLEERAEPAVVPEGKGIHVPLSSVPDEVDKLMASHEDLKKSEPRLEKLEDRDYSPVVDGQEDREMKAAKSGEPVRTPADFPDRGEHAAGHALPKEHATYTEQPEDQRGTAFSPVVDEQKPRQREGEPILSEEKESVVASSAVPEAADSKATTHDDFEHKPQLQTPEDSGRHAPSAVDEHKTADHKAAMPKEPKTEPAASTESKQPETAGIEEPEYVGKKAAVPEELKEQELRLEKPEDSGLNIPSPVSVGEKVDERKHYEFEPATSPHRHEHEVPVLHDVKPETGESRTEAPMVHDREPGAEPQGKLPERSSFDAEGIVTSPDEEMVEEAAGSVKDDHEARKSITEIQEIEDYEPEAQDAQLHGIVTSPLHSVTDDDQRLPVDSEDDEQSEGIRITELRDAQQKERVCKAAQELASDVLKSDETQLQDTARDQPSQTGASDATSLKPEVPLSSYAPDDDEVLAATTLIAEVDGTIAEDLIAAKEKAQQQLQDYSKDDTPAFVPLASLQGDVTLETSTKDAAAQLGEELPHLDEPMKDFPGIERVAELIDDSFQPTEQASQQSFQEHSQETLSSEDHERSAQPGIDQETQPPSDSTERTDSSQDVRGASETEPDKTTAVPLDEACSDDKQEVMKVKALPKSQEVKKDLPSSEIPAPEAAEPLLRQSADGLHEAKPDITDKEPLSSAETCTPMPKQIGSEVAEAVCHDAPERGQAEHVPAPKDHERSKQDGAPVSTDAAHVESPQAEHTKMSPTEGTKGSHEREPSPPVSEIKGLSSGESLPGMTRADEAAPVPAHSERSKVDSEPAGTPSGRTGDICEPSEVPEKEQAQDKFSTPKQAELPQPSDSSSAEAVETPLHPTAKPYDTKPEVASQEDRDVSDSKAKRDDIPPDTQAESVPKDAKTLDASLEPRGETELQTDTVNEGAQPSTVQEKADVEDAFPLQPDQKAQEVPEDACLKRADASMPKDDAGSTILAPETKGDESTAKDLDSDSCKGESTPPCDASVSTKATTIITVEREVIKQDLHLPLETPAKVGGVYSKARELLDKCVSGADSTSPGGAMSTGSPKSSVSEESVPSVVPKDEDKDASAKEKEHDKMSDEDIAPCSGCTTGYDFRSPSEVLKRDFLEETSNSLGKDVDMGMVMLSPSQDEEGRRILEIIKGQLICEDSTHFDVTTGKDGLPGTKDIPPADSTKDITDSHIAGSAVEDMNLAQELMEKEGEMLPHIIDEITKDESHDVTLAVPQKLQVLEVTAEKPLIVARDGTAEPSSHADVPTSSQDKSKLSSPEKLPSEGTPQDKESSCSQSASTSEKAHGDIQDETRLDRPTEEFQDTRHESSTRESKPADQVSSEPAEDKSSKPEIPASQAHIATESFRTPEDSGHHIPSGLDASPGKDLGSLPVTLKESKELPEIALVSGKDKEPGSTCEAPPYDSEIALTKDAIFDARLSSGSEGTKARGEAQFGEDSSAFSPSLTPQKQDPYDPETPWAEHSIPPRDSEEVPLLEIQDQPMKDPRATCPTALDTPELAHIQQRLSVEYESSITSVSEIEFTVDAKSSGAPPSDSSSRDDSKEPGVSKDEKDTSRVSSPESPPQSPVKRLAPEHTRPSKRSRTVSESKHAISTQGSSEADISSEDEESGKSGLPQHHTPATTDGGDIQKASVTPKEPRSLVQGDGAQDMGDISSAPSETKRPQASRLSLETETTSSSDDAISGPASRTSKDSELMREYRKHLETSPDSRFSLDSTCSVTSEEKSYTELEKPYQREYSRESFSSMTREYPQDSSRSGSLHSDSTLEPLSTVPHYEAGSPDTTSPTTEGRPQIATIPHSHGIASGLFAALKTELCVIDSPSMDSVLDQTGKDAQPLSDHPTSFTSPKVTEGYKEPSAVDVKQPGSEQETIPDQVRIGSGKEAESAHQGLPEAPEQVSDREPRKTHPVPPLMSEKQPASGSEAASDGAVEPLVSRKVSGEITPSKTLRFQLPEEPTKEALTDQSAKDSPVSSALLDDESQSKELFERAVRLEQLNEAEFLESMATDEEDDLSRASLKPSSSSTASSLRYEDGQKSAEPDDDVTEDDVTLASALSSGLPTELVCMAQSSVDISKDISRIAKCTDSLELATSPPRSPQDAERHDEPAAVAAGLASGLPVELVCMVESKELLSEIKRAEEEAIHLVIEKKADYEEEGSGAAMQTYIERRLSDSSHCTDKQPLTSPTLKAERTSKTGEPAAGQRAGKEVDDLHINGTSHSPPSVGLVAGLAAGLATELVCMPQSAEELCIEAAESSRSPRGSQAEVIPPEMTASMYEERTDHLDERLSSDADSLEYSGQGVPESTLPLRMGQIPVQREVITTVTSRRVVYQNDGPPDTWTTSTLSDAPQHDAEDDSKRTTVTYVYRTYTSGEGDDKEGPVLSSGSVPSRFDEDGLPFDMLRSSIARHAGEEEPNLEVDQVTGSTTRRYVYTISSDQGTPEMLIRQSDDSDSTSHPDSSIHSIAMDEVARITEMAAAAVSQSPNGWTVVHRSADSSSQRPLELTRPAEFVDRRNGHVTHVTQTRQIVYQPGTSGELHFPLGRSAEETCLPPEGSDPKTILEFMAAQTKQAAKEMLEEQPLYEEDEEAALEQSSLSDASPLVEEPVFAKTLQPDYPELVELSAGNTPSEPPSPHSAVHDARARHNGEPSGTSVQRMAVVEETEPPSTPGRSQARRVVSYVEEPTTVVREEWVLEGGHGEAPQVISQSSMFHHEILTVEGSTTTTASHTSGGDPVRSTHHFESGMGAADGALQQSSLKASAAVHVQQERSRGTAETTAPTIAATTATTSIRQDAVRELQAATERQTNGRRNGDDAPFDIKDWGKPLGLPVPPDPSSKSASKTGRKAAPRNATDVVYVDLTYVPHHGDPGYCDAEFFSRVRARYYVLSGTNPSQQVLDALLEAKRGWGEPDAPVTVIPTYETDALCYWIAHNQKALEEHHIDVAPSASRCTINLQDHESSCAAYRLEF